jgi:hypothetical protein
VSESETKIGVEKIAAAVTIFGVLAAFSESLRRTFSAVAEVRRLGKP